MKPSAIAAIVIAAALILFGAPVFFGSYYIVEPGERGVSVTLGNMSKDFIKPGFGFKAPFITTIRTVNVQQDTKEVQAECFSSDLQQINIRLKVLYRIPETSAVSVLRDYAGEPFDKLILPRVQEAIKEVTALKSAQDIVKSREQIKATALQAARQKVGAFLTLEDLVIEDVALSQDLENAIEQKMVQQQEAEKAVFKKDQAETDAETAIIQARGLAESIRIQGEALEKNPKLIELKMVEKWNGIAPLVVGAGQNIMLPMSFQQAASAATPAK
jgi:prohibitin 2